MDRQSFQSRRLIDIPVPSGVYTQSGDTGPLKGYGGFKSILAQLEVPANPSPSGTLTVHIDSTLDGVNWWEIPSGQGIGFVAMSASGVQQWWRDDGIFGDTLRVRWDISAGAAFNFNVKWQLGE